MLDPSCIWKWEETRSVAGRADRLSALAMSYVISHQAYIKIVFHAAQHPHKPVNGVLLGRSTGSSVDVVDTIPLLHHWTSLSPSMEIGLDLVRTTSKMPRRDADGRLGIWTRGERAVDGRGLLPGDRAHRRQRARTRRRTRRVQDQRAVRAGYSTRSPSSTYLRVWVLRLTRFA